MNQLQLPIALDPRPETRPALPWLEEQAAWCATPPGYQCLYGVDDAGRFVAFYFVVHG
jgi:hypothetical protein